MMSCYMYSLMHACIPYRSHAHAQDLILASSAGSSLAVTITIIVDTSAQVYRMYSTVQYVPDEVPRTDPTNARSA